MMNTAFNTWLSASVFYNNAEYKQLISDGVLPLLNLLEEKKLINGHICSFSSVQGDSLRLSMLFHDQEREIALDQFHHVLSRFLVEFPSENKQASYPLNGFLCPFPNNSIQYNLHDHHPSSFPAELIRFRMGFSSLLLDFFSLYDHDEETTIYFLFCSVLFLMEAVTDCYELRGEQFLQMTGVGTNINPEKQNAWNYFFHENRQVILETFYHGVQGGDQTDAYLAGPGLKQCFRSFVQSGQEKGVDVKSIVAMLTKAMLLQLGLPADALPLVHHIFGECLQYKDQFRKREGGIE